MGTTSTISQKSHLDATYGPGGEPEKVMNRLAAKKKVI